MIPCCQSRTRDPEQKELQPANQLSKAMMIEKYISQTCLGQIDQDSSMDETIIVNKPQDLINNQIMMDSDWLRLIYTKNIKEVNHAQVLRNLHYGVTFEFRPALWMWMSDANKLKAQHGNDLFVKLKNTPSNSDSQIFKEIQIALKGKIYNRQEDLFDLLRAYSNYDNKVSMTQEVIFLMKIIFDVFDVSQYKNLKLSFAREYHELTNDFSEVTTFWIFVYLMYGLKMREALTEKHHLAFYKKIEKSVPHISKHLNKLGTTLHESFESPIQFILLKQCPSKLCYKIMDVLLWQGQDVMTQIIINILLVSQEVILLFQSKQDLQTYLNQSLITSALEVLCKSRQEDLFKSK